jgi:hypothetical protein
VSRAEKRKREFLARRRAQELVGRFMSHFAHVEGAMDRSIWLLMGISGIERAILAEALTLVGKVEVLNTILYGWTRHLPDHRKRVIRLRKNILAVNNWRKIAAHQAFDAAHEGGVEFQIIRAKPILETPNAAWDEADCQHKFKELIRLKNEIHDLVDDVVRDQPPRP